MFCIDTYFEFLSTNQFVDRVDNFVDNRIFSTFFLFFHVDKSGFFPLSRGKTGFCPQFSKLFRHFLQKWDSQKILLDF